jgi:hypothetical protein
LSSLIHSKERRGKQSTLTWPFFLDMFEFMRGPTPPPPMLVVVASVGLVALATLLQRRQRRRHRRDILLIPYPGGSGRMSMLQRLVREMPDIEFAVLVPQELAYRYGWTREEVGTDNYLCYDGAPSGEPVERALDVVLKWSKVGRIAGILCYDEYGLELSARLTRGLGLVGTGVELLHVLRDKHTLRCACAAAGMRTLRHMPCDADAVEAIASGALAWPFPSILKPRSGAGSECTLKIDSAAQLRAGWTTACARMGTGAGGPQPQPEAQPEAQPGRAPHGPTTPRGIGSLIPGTQSRSGGGPGLSGTVEWTTFDERIKRMGFVLEEYFEGVEVDVDGWACDGHVDFALVAENRAPIEPTMDEVGGTYPIRDLRPDLVERLRELPQRVLDAASASVATATGVGGGGGGGGGSGGGGGGGGGGGFHGCFHFEARVNPHTGEVMPIEWNARLGGAECPESVEAVSGHWLPRVAAELAVRCSPCLPQARRRLVASHDTVVSANIQLMASGRLTALRIADGRVACAAQHIVALSLFTNQVGAWYTPGRGSSSCLGWIAAGGASKAEATAKVKRLLEQVVVELDGERVPMQLVCDHIRLS